MSGRAVVPRGARGKIKPPKQRWDSFGGREEEKRPACLSYESSWLPQAYSVVFREPPREHRDGLWRGRWSLRWWGLPQVRRKSGGPCSMATRLASRSVHPPTVGISIPCPSPPSRSKTERLAERQAVGVRVGVRVVVAIEYKPWYIEIVFVSQQR